MKFFDIDSRIIIVVILFFSGITVVCLSEFILLTAFPEEEIQCTVVKTTKTMNSIYKEPWAYDSADINVIVKSQNALEQAFTFELHDNNKISRAMEYYKEGSVHRCKYVGGIGNEIWKLDTYFTAVDSSLPFMFMYVTTAVVLCFSSVCMFVFYKLLRSGFFDSDKSKNN